MNLANIMKTMAIVAKHCDPEKEWCSASHDILFLPLPNDTVLPPEDEAELKRLGAHKSSEGGCWSVFT